MPLKALIAMLAAAALGAGGYLYLRSENSTARATMHVDITDIENGTVTVSWARPAGSAVDSITGYRVTVRPAGNDRVPGPPPDTITPPPKLVPVTTSSITISGLLEDCHQLYQVVVRPETGAGADAPVMSRVFRPSGIVERQQPPYVVILLDGIGEFKPGFTMDPYDPTNKDETPSYCPENVSYTGQPVINDFPHEPHGPWEFFRKWNFFDPSDTVNNDPERNSNSTPRDLSDAGSQTPGAETHTFMLDAVAGAGGVILPFSYNGPTLSGSASKPLFTFPAYTICNSTPGLLGGPGCDRDPGGSPDPRGSASNSLSISDDEHTLAIEVASIRSVWRGVPIIVVGHSQGGLIAFDAWKDGLLGGVQHLFSIDSPINGVCPARIPSLGPNGALMCVGPADTGYPEYDSRIAIDASVLSRDRAAGEPFRFIGTNGDEVVIKFLGDHPAYGTGDETLQHQLLVEQGRCVSQTDDAGCPEGPGSWPDHISNCPIPASGWARDDQHFVVKFCPGNVNYFNTVLGLSVDQPGPHPLRRLVAPMWSQAQVNGPQIGPPDAVELAYDSALQRVIMFHEAPGAGGASGCLADTATKETWAWSGTGWTELDHYSGPGTASGPSFLANASTFGVAVMGMAYDSRLQRVVLIGVGCASVETWTFDGHHWELQHPVHHPPDLAGASVAYDPSSGRIVLFGGFDPSTECCSLASTYDETWTWGGNDWTDQHTTGAPARAFGALAVDPISGGLLLYGGQGEDPASVYRWTGHDWRRQTVQGPAAPPLKDSYAMVTDPLRNRALLLGVDRIGTWGQWTWDGHTWGPVTSATSPHLHVIATAYDDADSAIVAIGGQPTTTWVGNELAPAGP